MTDQRIWTAAELERMSPDERDALIRSGFVTDPDLVPPELLERARARVARRVPGLGEVAPEGS